MSEDTLEIYQHRTSITTRTDQTADILSNPPQNIDEAATACSNCDAERTPGKFSVVCASRNKRKSVIALVVKVEDTVKRNDSRSIYHIRKELARGSKHFDDPVKNVNGRLLIDHEKQLKRWKGHFTAVLNRNRSGMMK